MKSCQTMMPSSIEGQIYYFYFTKIINTVTNVIEYVGFVYSASPYANHVLIAIDEELKPCAIPLR